MQILLLTGLLMTGVNMVSPGHPSGLLLEQFDSDGNGALARSELESGLGQKFAALDSDGDGRIAFAELPLILDVTEQEQARLDARIERRTRQLERRGEAVDTATLRQRMTPTRARFFARHDLNADEIVTPREFSAPALQHFDRADLDDDGTVTGDEITTVRKRRHGGGRGGPAGRRGR